MFARERRERAHRGGLLGRLLAASDTPAEIAARDRDLGHEALAMLGAALLDQRVGRGGAEQALGQLLQLGLVIPLPERRVLDRLGGEVPLDDRAGALVAGVEID